MPRTRRLVLLTAILISPVLTGACTSSGDGGADGGGTVYVPLPTDFSDYTTWKTYVEPDAGGDGVILAVADGGGDAGFIHAPGGRVEYINQIPPHGSTEFPVGTIIVKSIPAQQQVFAMAKVGGGYNPNGPGGQPLDWEWFELNGTGDNLIIVWQGAHPPANQSYGGTPQACNDCHSGFASNDFVGSSTILLKNF